MLQSLGHILAPYRNINKNYKNIISCFPMIHCFTPKKKINLLKINKPYDFNNSFNLLFNADIIWKYLQKIPNHEDIFYSFYDKLCKIYNLTPKEDEIKRLGTFCNFYKFHITGYRIGCEISCFGGWADTPGYYLLSCIDYNAYFKELKIIDYDIEGIYIEQDQDEIILFNLTNITSYNAPNNIYYIFPYMLKDLSFVEKKNFIKKYICYSCDYKKTKKLSPSFISMLNNYKNINKDDKWNFSWYKTKCSLYDPYTEIYDDKKPVNEKGCAEFESCKHRIPSYIKDENTGITDCIKPWKSNKISIENLNNIKYLLDYIEQIKTWNDPKFTSIIDLFCKKPDNIERTKN